LKTVDQFCVTVMKSLVGLGILGVSLSAHAVAPSPKQICNVVTAGADPTGANLSDTAFVAAIDCAKNNNFVPVYVPPGLYKLNNPLLIPADVSLQGDFPSPFGGDNGFTTASVSLPTRLVFPKEITKAIVLGTHRPDPLSLVNPPPNNPGRASISGVHIEFRNYGNYAAGAVWQDPNAGASAITVENPEKGGTGIAISNVKTDLPTHWNKFTR
jgi:hypothetical protein